MNKKTEEEIKKELQNVWNEGYLCGVETMCEIFKKKLRSENVN